MNKRIYILLWLALILGSPEIFSQDTLQLNAVDVHAGKIALSGTGKKTETLDTNARQQFIFSSLADALSLNSSVFIKNYGPGSLSSTAFRGGSAGHTAVLWNGFNIQNVSLGQSDLALLPGVLFDNVQVEYGGSSSLWGTGAVAGSIHLFSSPVFNRGITTKVNLSAGSFGLFNASTHIEFSRARFFSSTKAYLQNSSNNYKYLDTLNAEQPLRELKHASYSFKGIAQEFKFLINSRHSLAFNAWYNLGYRQIPSFSANKTDKAFQVDDNLKSSLCWNYYGNKFSSTVKTALFKDVIKYNDSLVGLDSKNRTLNFITENENVLNWSETGKLNFGLNVTSSSALSDNYNGVKTLNRVSFLIGNRFSFIDEKFILYPALRAEYFSAGALPLTGNISMEYRLFKNLIAKLNSAKVYRQPTFNELYWQPGGNPELLPEQGYTAEGDLSYSFGKNHWMIITGGSAFYRIIDNWILWLPGAGNSPTPVNIQRVWSRGTETKWKAEYQKNKFRLTVGIMTSYVLSTVHSSFQENGNTKDKQLIYTPRYSTNGNLTMAFNGVSFTYYHQYTGYRFTTSDNSQWLLPYHYSSLRCNYYSLFRKDTRMILFAACNNLFNVNYSIISGRYMPLRNFELGISLSTNRPNKSKTEEIIQDNN